MTDGGPGSSSGGVPVGTGAVDGGEAPDSGPGAGPGPTDGGTPLPPSPFVVLDYEVVDAVQSTSLASLVLVTASPSNKLHIFNERSQVDRAVTLPAVPIAVAVDPAGKRAAVAYDANVSLVDLATGKLVKTCPLGSNAYDIVLTNAGVAYVVPATDQWVPLHAVAFDTCTDTGTNSQLRAASHVELHPSESALFTADQGLSPSRVDRCDITKTPPQCTDAQGQADWGTYSYCGNLWMSEAGERIYTACGVTLRVPGNINGSPCTYGGTLEGVTGVQHLFEAGSAGKLALIPRGTDDGTIRIHETAYLKHVRDRALPGFPTGATSTAKSHGRFVFTTKSFDMAYVVVQADPSSGALHDYGIASFVP